MGRPFVDGSWPKSVVLESLGYILDDPAGGVHRYHVDGNRFHSDYCPFADESSPEYIAIESLVDAFVGKSSPEFVALECVDDSLKHSTLKCRTINVDAPETDARVASLEGGVGLGRGVICVHSPEYFVGGQAPEFFVGRRFRSSSWHRPASSCRSSSLAGGREFIGLVRVRGAVLLLHPRRYSSCQWSERAVWHRRWRTSSASPVVCAILETAWLGESSCH